MTRIPLHILFVALVACALGHAYGPQPERGVFRTICPRSSRGSRRP